VQTGRNHPRAVEPYRQLPREQNVAELGLAVSLQRSPILWSSKLGEIQTVAAMRLRGHMMIRAGPEALSRSSRRQVRRNGARWLTAKVSSKPVKRKPVSTRHQPGIVDEHIDPIGGRKDLVRRAAHFGKARESATNDIDSIGVGMRADKTPCRLGPGAVATDHDDSHSDSDEAEHRVEPDT